MKGYEEPREEEGYIRVDEENAFDRVKGLLGDGDDGDDNIKKKKKKEKSASSTSFQGSRLDRAALLALAPSLPLSSAAAGEPPTINRPLLTHTDASSLFLVPKSDLITLPYTPAKCSHGDGSTESKLVRVDQVRELCLRRFKSWVEVEEERGRRQRKKADRIREELTGGGAKRQKKR